MRAETRATLDAPDGADAWLRDGPDEWLTAPYLSLAAERAMPDGWSPAFVTVRDADGVALLVPLMRAPGRLASLTTPYTCLWAPLYRPGLPDAARGLAARAAGRVFRRAAVTRLDALDAGDPGTMLLRRAIGRAGLQTRTFGHFAAWTGDVAGLSADAYLAARPGPLRGTLKRKRRRVEEAGLSLHILDGERATAAIPEYEAVAARSWKPAEPFPGFLRAWMAMACADGTGRVALLCDRGRAVAAQFWTVRAGRARVHKLVHEAEADGYSPGTVLTAAVCAALIGDGADTLDFGRGDDPYKASWVSVRTPRSGILAAAPWTLAGAASLIRHDGGRIRALLRQRRPREQDP